MKRIRAFSAGAWLIGTVAVAIVAWVSFPVIMVDPDTGDVYVDQPNAGYAADYAFAQDDPQELEIVDGVIQGTTEGGYIRLAAGSDLLLLTPDEDDEAVFEDGVPVHQQLDTAIADDPDDREWPEFLGSLWPENPMLVMPGATDGLLWFGEARGEWTAEISTSETVTMGEHAEGAGNAVLLYEGDALSGRFQHFGTGLFIVEAVTVGDAENLFAEYDEVDLRASWAPTDRVAFLIQADTGDGTWAITMDTPAADPTPTTTP